MRRRWVKRYRRALIVCWAVWFTVVIAGSLLPGRVVTAIVPAISDKIAHAVMYSGLGLLQGLILESRWSRIQSLIAAVVAGMLLEAAQAHIPGRGADWTDVMWNVSGALFGWMIAEGILLTAGDDKEH
jgi:VanZ family protein